MDHLGEMRRIKTGFQPQFFLAKLACLAPYVGPARLKSSQNTRENRLVAINCIGTGGPDDSWTPATIFSHDDRQLVVALSRASRGRPAAPTRGSAVSGPRRDGRRLSTTYGSTTPGLTRGPSRSMSPQNFSTHRCEAHAPTTAGSSCS